MREGEVYDIFDRIAEWVWVASWGVALIWFCSIVGYQFFIWLKHGKWFPVEIVSVFDYFGVDTSPVYWPDGWFGAATMAQRLLALPLSVTGAFLIIFAAYLLKSSIKGERS